MDQHDWDLINSMRQRQSGTHRQNAFYRIIFNDLKATMDEARRVFDEPDTGTVMGAKRSLCIAKGLIRNGPQLERVRKFNALQRKPDGPIQNVTCRVVGTKP